jgi:hypothetical protein
MIAQNDKIGGTEVAPNPNPAWLDVSSWRMINALEALPAFKGFVEEIIQNLGNRFENLSTYPV